MQGQDSIWSYIVVWRLLSRLDLDLKGNFNCDQDEFDCEQGEIQWDNREHDFGFRKISNFF